MKYLLPVCLLLFTGPAVDADAYKWTDGEGNVHYGDRPPVDQSTDIVDTATAIKDKNSSPAPVAAPLAPEAAPPEQSAPASGDTVASSAGNADNGASGECGIIKAKLEKYKKGLIDFSYESATGRKITPARAKVIEAYEDAINEACG